MRDQAPGESAPDLPIGPGSVAIWTQPTGRATGLAVTGDDVYVVGYFRDTVSIGDRSVTSVGDEDIFLARFHVSGRLQWVKTIGGTSFDRALAIAVLPGNQVVITGNLVGSAFDASGAVINSQPSTRTSFVAWYSQDGDQRRVIPDLGGSALAADAQGNLAIGRTPLVTFGPSGAMAWQASDRFNDMSPQQLIFDGAGNLIVTNTFLDPVVVGGRTHTPMGRSDVIVAKYLPSGSVAWSARLGEERDELPTGLTVDASGRVYVSGEIYDGLSGGETRDVFVHALSGTDGAGRWSRTVIRPGPDRAGAILAAPAGDLFATIRVTEAGDLDTIRLTRGAWLLRMDLATGAPLAARAIDLLPTALVHHASGDLLGAEGSLGRLTPK